MRTKQSIEINASRETIWSLVDDIKKWGELLGIDTLERIQHLESGSPYAYSWMMHLAGRDIYGETRYSDFDPPSRFAKDTRSEVFRGSWELALENLDGNKTKVICNFRTASEPGLTNWVLAIPLYQAYRQRISNMLKTLKSVSEAQK